MSHNIKLVKNLSLRFRLDEAVVESLLARQESGKPDFSTIFNPDQSHILSRRPTRLRLQLLSSAKKKRLMQKAKT